MSSPIPCIEIFANTLSPKDKNLVLERYGKLIKKGLSERDANRQIAVEEFEKVKAKFEELKVSVGIKTKTEPTKTENTEAKVKEITDSYNAKIEEAKNKLNEEAEKAKVINEATNEGATTSDEPIPSKKDSTTKEDVGEDTQGAGGGKEPPKVEENKGGDDAERLSDKGVLNRMVKAKNLPEETRIGLEKEGLKYKVKSRKEAKETASAIIDELGIEEATILAEANKFKGGTNTAIFTESLNRLAIEEANTKDYAKKVELAKKIEELTIRLDELSRTKGQDISYIDEFYRKSEFAIQWAENKKRKEGFEEWAKPKEKSWKEFFDEMMKEPDFENVVKEEVKEGMKKERAESRAKRIEKINDIFDNAIKKLDNGGAAYSTIIPITPKVLQEALKAMKKAYNAGEKVAKIIEDAIDYISTKMGNSEWDKDKFRTDWESKLKDKETPTDEEIKAKILDRFRNKLKGLNDKQRDELITKSFKKIVESGGLDYEDFRKIISEVTGRGEMTLEEAARLKELVRQTNLVDEAAKNAIEVRTKDAINKYNEAQKTASKASRELSEMLYTKPNILKRLTSLMQLNTLGIASLVNNPIYNIINQVGLRLPIGVVKTLVDKGISAGYKLKGGEYLSETDILSLQTQKEFFKKLGLGTRESLGQFLTGLNKQDYLQKEVYGSQIRPATALKDLWAHYKGEKNLTTKQVIDKMIQASPQGIMAEAIARTLNIGDKPQRYAAEGAQASAFAKALGLKGIDYDLFIEFPREEAYMQYKKKGFSDADASRKSDYIKDIIIKEGERSTFQQDNLVSDMLNKIFGGEQSGIGGLAKSLIVSPYIKIPTNAYWSYFNLVNPEVAMLQSMIYGAKAFSKRNNGDNSSAKDFNEAKYWFAHGTVGFATRAVIGTLVAAGIFRSNNSDDDTKKEREGEQFYEQQGSINVSKLAAYLRGENPNDVKNGLVVQNRWFGHFGSIGNTIAKRQEGLTKEQKENGQEYLEMMADNLKLSGIQELEQGIFANTSSLLQLMKKGGSGANNWMMNTMNLMTNIVQPAVYAQISKAELPYYSKRKADTFMGEIKNNMLTRSSWLRKLTGENPSSKIGIWGDVLDKKDNVAMRLFGISKANDDNFAQPIYEDYKKTNNVKFFPSAVKPEIKIGDTVVKLDAKQSEAFEVLVGKQRKDLIAPFINDMAVFEGENKKYSELSDEDKIKKLEILYEEGFNNAKELFLKENPQLKENELTDEQKQLKRQEASKNETFRKSLKNKDNSW